MRISDWSSDVCSSDLQIELFASKTYTGPWGISQVEPEAWPRGLRGMRVQRFDHCQLHGQDIEAMRDLLAEVLGFYVTEHVVDADGGNLAIFMSLAMKAHDIALILDERHGTFHHAAFYMDSWESLLRAGDLVAMTGTSLDTAPTRHGITRGQTTYFFDPSGNRNEAFAGGSRSEEHTSELQSLMRISYAVFCLKKK